MAEENWNVSGDASGGLGDVVSQQGGDPAPQQDAGADSSGDFLEVRGVDGQLLERDVPHRQEAQVSLPEAPVPTTQQGQDSAGPPPQQQQQQAPQWEPPAPNLPPYLMDNIQQLEGQRAYIIAEYQKYAPQDETQLARMVASDDEAEAERGRQIQSYLEQLNRRWDEVEPQWMEATTTRDAIVQEQQGRAYLEHQIPEFETKHLPGVVKHMSSVMNVPEEAVRETWARNPFGMQMAYESMLWRRAQAQARSGHAMPVQVVEAIEGQPSAEGDGFYNGMSQAAFNRTMDRIEGEHDGMW